MSTARLNAMRDLIQEDVGNRGLRSDPQKNLISACADDFAAACHSVAETPAPKVGIVTGFLIPHAEPPAGETDGPLGALFLARALTPLGAEVIILTDSFCIPALKAGLDACGLADTVGLISLPPADQAPHSQPASSWNNVFKTCESFTHLVAVERVGPSHCPESLIMQPATTESALTRFGLEVPEQHHDRCHTMKGRDITPFMSPAHELFERSAHPRAFKTIGIGDGGNEIGMGKISWDVIRRNIPGGGLVACRIPTDLLIVCGVSNWGAYGLAAGVRLLRGHAADTGLFNAERERDLLQIMVERGPLVDGVTGKATVSVDGLPFERYAEVLKALGDIG